MRKLLLLPLLVGGVSVAVSSAGAQAGGWHKGPPCPHTKYWHLSRKAYGQWSGFKLFSGSWGERHKVVRRYPGGAVLVKVWRPEWARRWATCDG